MYVIIIGQMAKEEKTIDGLSVRSAKDSKLVARSKASKISANKKSAKKPVAKVAKTAKVQKVTVKTKTAANVAVTSRPKAKAPVKKVVRPKKVAKVSTPKTVEIKDEDELDLEVVEREKEAKIEAAHEDFLAPVESFGFVNDEEESEEKDAEKDEVEEGEISEVDDEEVADMKKSKKELKEAEKRAKKERKELKKQGKKSKKKVVVIVLVILFLLIAGAGVAFYFWGNEILKRITGGEGDIWSAIGALTSETYEPLKTDANGRTNVLVFGTSGYNMEGTGIGGYEHDGSQLTDSIMVISLDQETGDVAMVSLPRDLYAVPTCTATGKINEVYYCAINQGEDETGAARALQVKVEEILGVDIQYFVHINWGALVSVVDTLGGVTVTLDEDINDYGWTNAVFEAGVPTTVNGEEALGLARARHGTTSGDFTRGNSQQKLLIAIKEKIVEKGLGVGDALGILSALGDNLRTNLNMSEMKTTAHLLEQFDLESMRQIPLVDENNLYMTTASINGISYVVPVGGASNYSTLQEYIREMLIEDPVEREGAKIEVLNGSGEAGVASGEREKLEKEGFRVAEIGDAPDGEYSGVVVYDASEGAKPETKKALEKFYGVSMREMSELPEGVSPIGVDFIVIVGK